MTYNTVIIFTKRANLLPYAYGKMAHGAKLPNPMEYYEKEREIQLRLLVRFDKGGTICKVKCPINPLPVNGEFRPVRYEAVVSFIEEQGWAKKSVFNKRMLED